MSGQPLAYLHTIHYWQSVRKFVKNVTVNYFQENEFFYNLQFGLRLARPTVDAVDTIPKKTEIRQSVLAQHIPILPRHSSVSTVHSSYQNSIVRALAFEWFKSYLSEWRQYTYTVEQFYIRIVPSGISQGSVLGPLVLFSLYLYSGVLHGHYSETNKVCTDLNIE